MGVFKRKFKHNDSKTSEYWYIDYLVDGKRRWESVGRVGVVSKSDAKKLLSMRKAESIRIGLGFDKPKKSPLFKEFAKEYIKFAKGNKRSWARDMYALRRLMPFFGDKRMNQISPMLIEKYKLKRKEEVTTQTVNKELSILRRIFNVCINWDRCSSNPMKKVRFFKESPPKERVLSYEEEKRLLHSSPEYLRAIITTALNTGMRKGELLSLQWGDIDFEGSYIHVKGTKTDKDRRIPINETLRKTLEEQFLNNFVSDSVSDEERPQQKSNDLEGIGDTNAVLRGQCPKGRAGSTPAFGTTIVLPCNVFTREAIPIRSIRTAFRNACLRAAPFPLIKWWGRESKICFSRLAGSH